MTAASRRRWTLGLVCTATSMLLTAAGIAAVGAVAAFAFIRHQPAPAGPAAPQATGVPSCSQT